MTNKKFIAIFFFILSTCFIFGQDKHKYKTIDANWESMAKNYQVPEWFQDGKIGVWMHWGIPSSIDENRIEDGSHYGRRMYGDEDYDARNEPDRMRTVRLTKWHTERYGKPSDFGYEKFIADFKAENFNADAIVQFVKESGARFIMPVATHHDNFDMYDLFMKLDDKLVKSTYNNSKEWFNQSIPLENIEEMYKSVCKPLKKNKNPSIKFKLPVENDKILSKIYDQNRELVDIKDCKSGYDAICILHIRGIKFMKQQYICDIYINQMKVNIPKREDFVIPDKCLIDEFDKLYDSDEDIIDNEIIDEINNEREIILKKKREELKRLQKLKDEIEMLEKDI